MTCHQAHGEQKNCRKWSAQVWDHGKDIIGENPEDETAITLHIILFSFTHPNIFSYLISTFPIFPASFALIQQFLLFFHRQLPFPERTRVTRSLSRHSSKSQASLDLDPLLTQKSSSRIDCYYLVWTDSSDRPYTRQENCVIFTLIYTPNLILHCVLSLRVTIWKINPDEKISFSLTKSIFHSLFADKFAIEIDKIAWKKRQWFCLHYR